MKTKKGFVLTAIAVLFSFSIVCSQTEVHFTADIMPKTYDGKKDASVQRITFYRTQGEDIILVPNSQSGITFDNYEVVSAVFNSENVLEASEVAVKIKLLDNITNRFIFNNGKDTLTLKFEQTINKASGYIAIACENIAVGQIPNPVVDTATIGTKTDWNNSDWLTENVVYRYAQMNMQEHEIDDPAAKPAWVSEIPKTQGTYWVQAILTDNSGNYTDAESRVETFTISPNSVAKDNPRLQTKKSFGFAGIINGEINLSLRAEYYTLEVYNLQGRLVAKTGINAINGVNATGLNIASFAKGMLILNVKQAGTSVLQHKIIVK